MASLTPDKAAAKLDPLLFVTMLGYVRGKDPADPGRTILVTDPWGDEWVSIQSTNIKARISGEDRPDGRSILWVERDAEVVQSHAWTAHAYALDQIEQRRGGAAGAGGGYSPPGGGRQPPG